MIFGIGCDIVEIARFDRAISNLGMRFLTRLFTEYEISVAPINPRLRCAYFAKRFAAKESYSKAFGRGLGGRISADGQYSFGFLDIEVHRGELGNPYFSQMPGFTDSALYSSHLSISDEKEFAIAYVIIEKK